LTWTVSAMATWHIKTSAERMMNLNVTSNASYSVRAYRDVCCCPGADLRSGCNWGSNGPWRPLLAAGKNDRFAVRIQPVDATH
jgi:hypothetical protein